MTIKWLCIDCVCIYASDKTISIRCKRKNTYTSQNVLHIAILVQVSSVMVGVPGKSKGCTTCRRRKIRVSIPLIAPPLLLPANTIGSVTSNSHSARHAPRVAEFARDMHVFRFFSTAPCRGRRRDMGSKKPRLWIFNLRIEICLSHSPWCPILISNGDS